MNFLAHLFLSGKPGEVMYGNYIADSVKGKTYENYRKEIQKGILLHRSIDDFTDRHEITEQSRILFRPFVRKYSGVAVDIVYDHFLARRFSEFSNASLQEFSSQVYEFLIPLETEMPEHPRKFLQYMIQNNILVKYSTVEGIRNVLASFAKRTRFESNLEKAIQPVEEHYQELEGQFGSFFPQILEFTRKKKEELSIT